VSEIYVKLMEKGFGVSLYAFNHILPLYHINS